MPVKRRLKVQKPAPPSQVTMMAEPEARMHVVRMRTPATSTPPVAGPSVSMCPPDLNPSSLELPKEPVKGVTCHKCCTEVVFSTNACPICGTPLDSHDNGLVRLFSGMEFEDDCSGEVDCPFCGETVILQDGTCPSCLEQVHVPKGTESSQKIQPVVHGENVVYVHLNVENGELDCIQRTPHRFGLEHLTIRIEGGGEQ